MTREEALEKMATNGVEGFRRESILDALEALELIKLDPPLTPHDVIAKELATWGIVIINGPADIIKALETKGFEIVKKSVRKVLPKVSGRVLPKVSEEDG
jgi:hypothetical protein